MITLHQYPEAFGLSSLSPFCIKVEFFLKVANLPYKNHVEVNPSKGPKGKMPFINVEGKKIPDSSFIIDYLLDKHSLKDLEIKDPAAQAQAIAFKSMIEDALYFGLLYSRWVDPVGFKRMKSEFKSMFPPFIGGPFLEFIRRNLIKQSRAQGLGRHSAEEVYAISEKQISALAALLGENEFFFENKVTYFDATSYAFLATILKQPIDSPIKKAILSHQNLCDYVDRLDVMAGASK
jgi:glutathione S-transferase